MSLWNDKLLKDLTRKALELNIKFCGSRAISESFTASYTINPPHIDIYTPYYWARYYKNGVDFVRFPVRGEWLIWYKNPEDDPRIAPVPRGYPVRRADIKHFDEEEFKQAKEDRKAGKAIFVRSAGPIPPHDWTPKVFLFWTIYAKIRLEQEMKKEADRILKPLRGLRIGS